MGDEQQESLETVVQDVLKQKKLRRVLFGGFSRQSVWALLLEVVRSYRAQLAESEAARQALEKRVQELEQGQERQMQVLAEAVQAMNAGTASLRKAQMTGPARRPGSDAEDRT